MLLVSALVTVGCGEDADTARDCRGPKGSPTDLTGLPEGAEPTKTDWADAAGCRVRRDVLDRSNGPVHCNWQRATFVTTSLTFGQRWDWQDLTTAAYYVKDPDGILGDVELARGYDDEATLPATAQDTGFRWRDTALWRDPQNDGAIYLVGKQVERWPRDRDPAFCA